jgi:hypothetical protein
MISPPKDTQVKQNTFDVASEYAGEEETGLKHEFNGTLFVPLEGQSVPPSPPQVEEVRVTANLGRPYEGPKRVKMNLFQIRRLMRRA